MNYLTLSLDDGKICLLRILGWRKLDIQFFGEFTYRITTRLTKFNNQYNKVYQSFRRRTKRRKQRKGLQNYYRLIKLFWYLFFICFYL